MAQKLNVDVLRLICDFLADVQTVLAFSLTCSVLRPIAVERRLAMRPITIAGAKSIRDLHDFIFVNVERRAQHIRAITIPVQPVLPDPPEELVDRLLAVLASATRLRALSFYVPDEPSTLFSHPAIPAAISNLTGLQELDLLSSVRVADQILASTHSALKTFRHSDVYGYEPADDVSLSPLTPHLASTLHEIELPPGFLTAAFRSSTSLPGVRSVTLTAVETLFRLEMLLAVFPHLDRTLVVDDSVYVDDIDRLDALREENRAAHLAHKHKARGRWAALDRVATTPLVLYALGLTCPIRHLSLAMSLRDHLSRPPDPSAPVLSSRSTPPRTSPLRASSYMLMPVGCGRFWARATRRCSRPPRSPGCQPISSSTWNTCPNKAIPTDHAVLALAPAPTTTTTTRRRTRRPRGTPFW